MSNEIAEQQAAQTNLIAIIDKVATSPDVDVEKMQALFDLQERIMNKNAEMEFNRSMVSALAEIPSFEESTKGHNSNYATFEQINKVVKPILAKYGLFVNFTTNFVDDGIMVTAIATHRDGHREQTTGKFPFDTSGNKNSMHATGSSISYGKRYMQNALLNITTHGEDDDGFASQKKIDSGQIKTLNEGLVKAGSTSKGLCEYIEVDKISDIPSDKYSEAYQFIVNIIESKK